MVNLDQPQSSISTFSSLTSYASAAAASQADSTGRWNYDVCELLRFVLCFCVDKNSKPERWEKEKITAQIIRWINHANLVFEELAFAAFMIKYCASVSSTPHFLCSKSQKLLIRTTRKKNRINNARVPIDLFFFAVWDSSSCLMRETKRKLFGNSARPAVGASTGRTRGYF